ncbi:MAG TPA: HDOD domain-containing protein, partial [Deltaproteobacteria bacterium]|nr:HDOD domain-containing protein [Deltaproteobacteria bacterium]
NLDWKPERNTHEPLPENMAELVELSEGFSPLVTELMHKLNVPEVSAKDVAHLIASDQGLTSFVLQRANSPFYSLGQKVDNIFNAVVLLGSTEISRIVIEERMNKSGIKPFRSEWLHAYITSTIAAYLSNSIGMATHAGTLVTMAMMHDIGRNILYRNLTQQEKDDMPKDPRDRLKSEIGLFGVDHARIGAMLARKWNIPENVSRCIEVHHWPMFWPLREIAEDAKGLVLKLRRRLERIRDMYTQGLDKDNNWRG